MPRNLGKMGESCLLQWASEIGIVANRSSEDMTGWDYILEFPVESDPNVPVDVQAPPTACLVQVKSTGNRRRRNSVRLSNWYRFVSSPYPAFFLILEYQNDNKVRNAYLVHVGEDIISNVIERLRKLKPGERNRINNKYIEKLLNFNH